MTRPSLSSLGLILLVTAGAAAGPELDRHPAGACQEHANLHSRLDLVEKKVRDAVGALEAELASLQEAVEAPNWRPLPDAPGEKPAGVILGEARPGKEGLLSA